MLFYYAPDRDEDCAISEQDFIQIVELEEAVDEDCDSCAALEEDEDR